MEKASGKEVWSYDTRADGGPFSFHGDPLVYKDLVLVPADRGCNVKGYLYAFEKATGKLRWKIAGGAPATPFLEIGGAVVVGTRQDQWISIDADSGKVKWKFANPVGENECEIPKPAVTDGESIAVVSHDQILHGLDPSSGRELRKVALPAPATTGLFMFKDVLYLGTEDANLRSFEPSTLHPLGERKLPAPLSGRFSWQKLGPEEFAEYAFGSFRREKQNEGMLVSFSDEFEKVLWSRTAEGDWASEQPHLWKEWVIAGNCRGEILAYKAKDGALAWKDQVQGCIRSFGHDDSTLYIGVQQGTVYAYRP